MYLSTLSARSWFHPVVVVLIVVMGLIGIVPRVEAGFISSADSAAIRQQDLATTQKVLENRLVMERLQAFGYNPQEIRDRMAQLNDEELHQFASQADTLLPAGDSGLGIIIAVLVIILLILLIINQGKKVAVSG
ncbi:MAG: PA2779 family protein [Deltaproteobacteria bacterium]|nr:PA2779 family protein [Deltaproteobacteria bacterium]